MAPAPMTLAEIEAVDPAKCYIDLEVTGDQKLGFRFLNTEITKIVPGGWAEQQGIEVDDELWEVNGKAFREMDEKERILALTQERPFQLKCKRPLYKDSYYEAECDEKKLGLRYVRDTVAVVVPEGWGAKSGVQEGDRIQEVNGKNFRTMSNEEIIAALSGPRPLKICFKRPHKKHVDTEAVEHKEEAKPEVVQEPIKEMPKSLQIPDAPKIAVNNNMLAVIPQEESHRDSRRETAMPFAPPHEREPIRETGGLFAACCSAVAPRDQEVQVVAANRYQAVR